MDRNRELCTKAPFCRLLVRQPITFYFCFLLFKNGHYDDCYDTILQFR